MGIIVRNAVCRVKPGRIDDAVAFWKEVKAATKDHDLRVMVCTTGGATTDSFLVSSIYQDGKSLFDSMAAGAEHGRDEWRAAHAADSPFENVHVTMWREVDL